MADSSDEDFNSDDEFIDLEALCNDYPFLRDTESDENPEPDPEPVNNGFGDQSRVIELSPISDVFERISAPLPGASNAQPPEVNNPATRQRVYCDLSSIAEHNVLDTANSQPSGSQQYRTPTPRGFYPIRIGLRIGATLPEDRTNRPTERPIPYRVPQRRNIATVSRPNPLPRSQPLTTLKSILDAANIHIPDLDSDDDEPPRVMTIPIPPPPPAPAAAPAPAPTPAPAPKPAPVPKPVHRFVLPAAIQARERAENRVNERIQAARSELTIKYLMATLAERNDSAPADRNKDCSCRQCSSCGQYIRPSIYRRPEDAKRSSQKDCDGSHPKKQQ